MSETTPFQGGPVACRTNGSASVGVVRWPARRTSVIVKLTLGLDARAWLTTLAEVPPLVDLLDEEGEVTYPSDFAPYKPMCDVIIGGSAIRERGAGRLRLGDRLFDFDAHESLGPRQSSCPGGDPSDPAFFRAWATGMIDPTRFQAAGPGRRMAWPTQPFLIDYERAETRFTGFFSGPFPRVLALDTELDQPVARVAMALDTIVIAPQERSVTVVFRGVIAAPGKTVWLAVNLDPGVGLDPVAAAHWRSTTLVSPASPRRASQRPAKRSDELSVTDIVPLQVGRETLPFLPIGPSISEPPSLLAPLNTEPVLSLPEGLGELALPFARPPSSRPRQHLSHDTLEGLRACPPVEAVHLGEHTKVGHSSHPPPEASSSPSLHPPAPTCTDSPASSVNEAELEPRRAASIAAPASPPSPISEVELVSKLRLELWRGERPARQILAEHGLTEESWRALRKSNAKRS